MSDLQDDGALWGALDDRALDELCDGHRDPHQPPAGPLDQARHGGSHRPQLLISPPDEGGGDEAGRGRVGRQERRDTLVCMFARYGWHTI